MIALVLAVIFLLVGLAAFIIPLSDSHILQLVFPVLMGLIAVVIVGMTIIIKKLNYICSHIKNDGKKEQSDKDLPKNKLPKDEE